MLGVWEVKDTIPIFQEDYNLGGDKDNTPDQKKIQDYIVTKFNDSGDMRKTKAYFSRKKVVE